MNKKGVGLLGYVIVLSILLFVGIGVIVGNEGIDITEHTQNITWVDREPSGNTTVSIGINKVVNAAGWIFMEAGKEFMKWGAENPDFPWKALCYLLLAAFIAPLILVLVKLIVIITIFLKDFFQSRRERKEIKRLRKLRYEK